MSHPTHPRTVGVTHVDTHVGHWCQEGIGV
jgi:hypothetical protein